MEENYTLEELKDKLTEMHKVTVFLTSPATYKMAKVSNHGMQLTQSRRVIYKTSAGTLAEMMATISAGGNAITVYGERYNFMSHEWEECYDTILTANITTIEWPERMIEAARAMVASETESQIKAYFEDGGEDAAQEEGSGVGQEDHL